MRRRWHWDFDDDQRPRRVPAAPPPAPAAPVPVAPPTATPTPLELQRAHRMRFHVRRATAVLIAALLVALVVALSSSSHHRATGSSSGGAHALALRAHPGVPPLDEGRVVSSTLAYTPFIREGGPTGRDIALTFDDGPGPYTPQLLSVLEREHVHATFFAIGRMLRYFGESTVRELNDGDIVANHTETHPMLARLSEREQHEELFEGMARIELVGGPRPRLFRPPYGSFNAATLRELGVFSLLMVLWSADTGDYQQPGAPVIVERALAGAHPGAIILMHDGGGDRSQTIAALPEIIHGLRHRGYHLVTVPQLLADDPPPHGQPLPGGLAGD